VAGKVSGMVFPPPWDPIVHDVTRLRLNQLFVGLAIFGSVCYATKHSGTASGG
jgi:hypothetical protein